MRQRRIEIVLAFASFILIGLGGGAGGILLPAQMGEYRVDKSIIGLLFFTFSAGYVLAGAVNGWLLHRAGPRATAVLGTAVFVAATFASGLRPAYPMLLLLTVGFGFGSGVIDASINAFLAGQPNRTVLLNLLHAFYGLGALAGPVLASQMLGAGLSWGAVYFAFAAAGIPLVLGFWLRYPRALASASESSGACDAASRHSAPSMVPGPAGEASVPTQAAGAAPRGAGFGVAIRHPAVLLSALFLTIYVGVEVSLGNWAFSFLVEERGQGTLLAGWVVSGFWLGFTLGRFVLSALADRFGIGPVALTFGCLGVLAAGTLVVWLVPGTVPAAVGFILVGAALGPVFPLTIAVLPQLAPGWLVPTAIGLLVGVSVIGGAFFPWLAGAIAERAGLDTLLPFCMLLTVLLFGNWYRIARRLRTP